MQKFNKHFIVDILFVIVVLALLVYLTVTSIGAYAEKNDTSTTNPTETTQRTLKEKIETIATIMYTEPTDEPTNEPETIPEETTNPETIEPAPESIDPEPDMDMTDLDMLACVIYQEAGSDAVCDDCRRRVADVVLNRVADERFPDTIYEVLTQESQYGRFYWTGIVWPDRADNETERHAVERAYRIAEEVLNGQHSNLYGEGYIWQAEFKQGSEQIYCCGIYFGR